jgi:hypothetical protein
MDTGYSDSPGLERTPMFDVGAGGPDSTDSPKSPEAVIPKRNRGRPRKNPLPAVSATGMGSGVLIASSGFGGAGIIEERRDWIAVARPPVQASHAPVFDLVNGDSVLPAKRKRGRPRKNLVPEAGVASSLPDLLALEPFGGIGVVGRVDVPARRGRGRPRKRPLEAAGAITAMALARETAVDEADEAPRTVDEPLEEVQADSGAGTLPGPDGEDKSQKPGEAGGFLVDRFGIGPSNDDGIGFWPPKPEEMDSVWKAAIAAGVVAGKKRGRKPKVRDSQEKED